MKSESENEDKNKDSANEINHNSKMADRKKAAEEALKILNKKFGKNTVVRIGDKPILDIATIPSGHPGIDEAIGIGGLPRGRVIEYYGPESQGKTTLGLLSIAATQKAGGICAYVDAEYALDKKWARSLGVDIDNLYINHPNCGEEALEVVETLVASNAYDLIIVDSVAALVPKEVVEGALSDDNRMGCQSRMMSEKLSRLTPVIGRSECVVIFINQVRSKIGVVYGDPETTPGGRALKFYASLRLRVSKVSGSDIKKAGRVVGHCVKITVKKNKVAPPFGESEFELIYAKPEVLKEDKKKDADKDKEKEKE